MLAWSWMPGCGWQPDGKKLKAEGLGVGSGGEIAGYFVRKCSMNTRNNLSCLNDFG